jgi:hypothetical protein
MSFGAWFLLLWVVLVAVAVTLLIKRQRQEGPMRDWVKSQPVVFEARAVIVKHARGMEGSGWAALKGVGWPRLVVHLGGIEATIAPFDWLISGNTMLTEGATMRRERLSAIPIVVGNQDCIRLSGSNGTGVREWKVSPRDVSIEELWTQLLSVGVTPSTDP